MQEGLDRRPPRAGIGHAVREVGDHRVVAHRLEVSQRQELVEEESREAVAADRAQIGAAALDAHHVALAPEMVALAQLGRRVASAVHHECGIRADATGALDQPLELARLFAHRACTGASPALSRVISSATIATPRSIVSAVAPPMCGVITTRGSSSSGLRLATGAGRTTSSAAPAR